MEGGWDLVIGEIRDVSVALGAAVLLWAAWDDVIAAHLLPGHTVTDEEFARVAELAREVLTLGRLAPQRGGP
jgi:hypothetical protein